MRPGRPVVVGVVVPIVELVIGVSTGVEGTVSETRVVRVDGTKVEDAVSGSRFDRVGETELVALSILPEAEVEAKGTTTSTNVEVSQQTSQRVSVDSMRSY